MTVSRGGCFRGLVIFQGFYQLEVTQTSNLLWPLIILNNKSNSKLHCRSSYVCCSSLKAKSSSSPRTVSTPNLSSVVHFLLFSAGLKTRNIFNYFITLHINSLNDESICRDPRIQYISRHMTLKTETECFST